MDLRHLEYVLELSRTKSLTKAAANLGVAQPAISQAISSLEREFSLALFDRTSRPVQPTLAGARFIAAASKVLREVDALRMVAQEHSALLRGTIRIGTVHYFGELVLPAIIADFHRQYVGIEFVLRREQMSKLIDGVRLGTLDLAFIDIAQPVVHSDLMCVAIDSSEIAVALPTTHPLATRSRLRLEELRDDSFVGYEEEASLHEILMLTAHAANFEPRIVARSQSQAIARALVSAGLGVTIASKIYLDSPGRPVSVVELSPKLSKETVLVMRASQQLNPITQPFVDLVCERLQISATKEP